MIDIVIKISMIFIMIFMGFVACRIKFIKSEAQRYLTDLILNITLPLMLINSISRNSITEDSLQLTIEVLVFSSMYFIIAGIAAIALVKMFCIRDIIRSVLVFRSFIRGRQTELRRKIFSRDFIAET